MSNAPDSAKEQSPVAVTGLITVHVNPLQCLAIDEPWASLPGAPPLTLEAVFECLCAEGIPRDLKSVAERWRELSNENKRLFAPPAEPKVLAKLVWPLRQAKANYVLGNYLATISVCGAIGEMVAMLIWDIADDSAKEHQKMKRKGVVFEHLGQKERVQDLARCKLIDEEARRDLTLLRETRRKHLHAWSSDDATTQADAATMYRAALARVVAVVGPVNIREGIPEFDSRFLAYLAKKGLIEIPRVGPGAEPRPQSDDGQG